MKINGRAIASELLQKLQKNVAMLSKKGITPHLVIILVGNDPASTAYVNQKKIKGTQIGIRVSIREYNMDVPMEKLQKTIEQLNNDSNIHGIIIQQPLPSHIDTKKLIAATNPQKDVDGFHKDSPFNAPIAEATFEILDFIRSDLGLGPTLTQWLKTQNIVVIGKGETGGAPIIAKFRKIGVEPLIIDSKTTDPKSVTKKADIIVSCVGRPHILTPDMIKKGVILLAIGMHKGDDGKLHADYDEEAIDPIAGYYTPVPGGVGPVNVACLLENVIKAARNRY